MLSPGVEVSMSASNLADQDVELIEIGRFVCPITKQSLPVMATRPMAYQEWPIKIEHCPGCGMEHLLNIEQFQHPPVFGYE